MYMRDVVLSSTAPSTLTVNGAVQIVHSLLLPYESEFIAKRQCEYIAKRLRMSQNIINPAISSGERQSRYM